ncbi:MAG: glycosyltransferase, partial [Tangfeifania sp.]
MYKQKSIGLIIPAFNEEENIEDVLVRIPHYIDHLIVVDDGSSDHTAEIAEKNGA